MTRLRIWTVFLGLALGSGSLLAQAPADLRKAMQERDRAVDGADAVAWDRLTADEFTLVDETGAFMTKAQRLAQLKSAKPEKAAPHEREQVTGQGDVFVRRFFSNGQWVLDVWVKKPTGWRVSAVQVTPAKK